MENKIDPTWEKMQWYHILSIWYFINPLKGLSELLFGSRIAKTLYITKEYNKKMNWSRKRMVVCNHCETAHNETTWSHFNDTKFFNWHGLYCPSCHEIIPVRKNLITHIVHILFFPVYYWINKRYKSQWLAKQPTRFENINIETSQNFFLTKHFWLEDGLYWTCFYILMFYSFNQVPVSLHKLVFFIFFVIISGFGHALVNKFINTPKIKAKTISEEKATSNV